MEQSVRFGGGRMVRLVWIVPMGGLAGVLFWPLRNVGLRNRETAESGEGELSKTENR